MSDPRPRVALALEALLPRDPSAAELSELVFGSLTTARAQGLDRTRVQELFFQPIRAITERTGKSWRSLLLEACCQAVGGDFSAYEPLLALPELVHVGSLIVDDVQDASEIRRGGPCCHLLHGSAIAINAGTGAYFLAEQALAAVPLSLARRDAIRTLMFEAFRGAHVGQALDLGGYDELVDQALRGTRPLTDLRAQVEVVHWLKAALPAAAFARVGCVLGEATVSQSTSLSTYVEAVGMGFQAIDDVLNLRGFEGGLKERGEDLRDGKLTLPVAFALERLPREEARGLWRSIRSRPQEPAVIDGLIETIERCGALSAAEASAHQEVDSAWETLVKVIEPSPARTCLDRLGNRLLVRHY